MGEKCQYLWRFSMPFKPFLSEISLGRIFVLIGIRFSFPIITKQPRNAVCKGVFDSAGYSRAPEEAVNREQQTLFASSKHHREAKTITAACNGCM
jgi:hypothetical protein